MRDRHNESGEAVESENFMIAQQDEIVGGSSCELTMANSNVVETNGRRYPLIHEDSERSLWNAKQEIAGRESKAISYSRFILFAFLIAMGAVMGFFVYESTRRHQEISFQKRFFAYADRLLQSFAIGVERNLGVLDSLSVSITSYVRTTNGTFPFVTLPNFVLEGANSRILADTLLIWWTPLVTNQTLEQWEEYVQQQRALYPRDAALQDQINSLEDMKYGLEAVDRSSLIETKSFSEKVLPDTTDPLYLPIWQMTPVIPNAIINFNTLAHPVAQGGLERVLDTGRAVVGMTNIIHNYSDIDAFISKAVFLTGQYRHQWDRSGGISSSTAGYPVFDRLDVRNRTVVGILQANLYWKYYISNLLPRNAGQMIAVLANTRNQTLSYRIDGPDVVDLGLGDHHDIKFDHLERQINVSDFILKKARPSKQTLTTVDLDSEFCSYSLRLYPTQQMESKYVDEKPFEYTVIILAVFVFTCCVFVVYDCLVERRLRTVLKRASKAGAIVASLFPATVRDRVYQEQQVSEGSSSVQTYLTSGSFVAEAKELVTACHPIADHFENTTVFFADIAGFTAWSSTRQPPDVFTLLEAFYQAFDALAIYRQVFKIETIGDCYVAVTGLPNPQEDHAVIACRFAYDCLKKVSEISSELALSMGQDTSRLGIRVGIHSGPVTAGVLRGQKVRFQLFGDTVNMASKMESTGASGRIHVSQATADALKKKGKSAWIIPREDAVELQGKGLLQTYWVEIKTAKAPSRPQA